LLRYWPMIGKHKTEQLEHDPTKAIVGKHTVGGKSLQVTCGLSRGP